MRISILASLLATLALPASAATLLTSNAGYTGPGLDLSAYANGMYNFTFGPIPVDGFTFTAAPGDGISWPFGGNSGLGSVVGQGGYGLGGNGGFGGAAVYIGVDSGAGFAQLLGPTAYSQIGFFMNYAPGVGNPATIETLDAAGMVISSFDLTALAPISTPGGFNAFEFRGIDEGAPVIYGLRFGGNYILVTGTRDGVPGPVPAPAALALFGLGLAALGIARRR
jgi:hypothetical protein